MRRLALSLWLSALALALARPASAQSAYAGTSGAQFLKLGAGARAGGMADAFSAIADDVYADYYNPAGLVQLDKPELAGEHTAYFQGVNYEVLGFAYPWGQDKGYNHHSLSLGIYQLSVSNIERRTSDSTDPVGTFGASDAAYTLSYAYAFDRRLSAGVTGKYIYQNLDTYRASAYALDAGVLYRMNSDAKRPLNLSAVLKNAGSRTGYVASETDPLPLELVFGAGYDAVPKALKLDFELAKYRDTNAFAALGGEYTHALNDAIGSALRFGYTSERSANPGLNGVTFGAGLTFKKAAFDFAWIPFGTLGDTFRYSLVVKF